MNKLRKLYSKAHEISEEIKLTNKYTWLAFHGILEAKYMDVNDTFTYKLPFDAYLKRYSEILLLPNIVNDKIIDITIRTLDGSGKILMYRSDINLPYGIGNLTPDFKYGDPLFVVEGIGDYAALKFISSKINVVALMGNSFSNSLYDFYASLTNNIVMIPDADKEGKRLIKDIKYKFKELGVSFSTIPQFGNLKDTGEIVDMIVEAQKNNAMSYIKDQLSLIKDYYITQINLVLES